MGITGLIPFLDKASRRANVKEFSGSTVAIDTYCWLHKGAFACADKLVRGEETDIHIKYCLKYVTMLLSRNIKPILVFDGRHLPAKAMTETKRRESRQTCKKRAAELLTLGKVEEARTFMRRSVDITHAMALALIKECRKRNVDCIVAPYEADAQLAYLNIKNYAQLVITEDSDLILFGCTKVLFKMDLEGTGTLVDTTKLPLVMKCPIEHYNFDKFRRMCIMSGCDYLASLPGIGLAKARQFVTATQDSNFANALRKLPGFFNRSNLVVTDEYRENFLKAEATFKHQYVYDPIERKMVRLTEPDDEDIETALCVNAGELLEPKIAFQLALGNLEPFTLKKLDDWDPDYNNSMKENVKTNGWKDKGVSNHPTIWSIKFKDFLNETNPWAEKVKQTIISTQTRTRKKIVTMVSKHVPETQDDSLSIESLSNMYCVPSKKQRMDGENVTQETYSQSEHNIASIEDISTNKSKKSPIIQNKERSYRKFLKTNGCSALKKLSRFPRTVLGNNVIESKFFNSNEDQNKAVIVIEESPEKKKALDELEIEECTEIPDTLVGYSENNSGSFMTSNKSPIIESTPPRNKLTVNPFQIRKSEKMDMECSEIPNIPNTLLEYSENNLSNPETSKKSPILESTPPRNKLTVNPFKIQPISERIEMECSEIPNTLLEYSQSISSITSKKSPILESIQPKNKLIVNPNKIQPVSEMDVECSEIPDSLMEYSNGTCSPVKHDTSPILYPSPQSRNPFRLRTNTMTSNDTGFEEDVNVIPDSQGSNESSPTKAISLSLTKFRNNGKKTSKGPVLKRTASLPRNQPTLLSMFGFQKKPVLKR